MQLQSRLAKAIYVFLVVAFALKFAVTVAAIVLVGWFLQQLIAPRRGYCICH